MRLKYPKPSTWIDNLWASVALVCVLAFAYMYIAPTNKYTAETAPQRIQNEEYDGIHNAPSPTDPPKPHRRETTPKTDHNTEARKALAERLSNGPKRIDWTKYSLDELQQLEVKKSIAEELAQRGILIDWETAPMSRLERALQRPPA